jgi:aspartate/tyrosine/aromatic aminotransferase
MSFFENLRSVKSDPIFGLNAILKADTRKDKIDLLIGYYKNEHGEIPIFKAVQEAEKKILQTQKNLNYLPIDGLETYINHLKELIFLEDSYQYVYGAQTVGGTSALHHLGKIVSMKGAQQIAIPSPTWANHHQIFEYLGLKCVSYPYYDVKGKKLLWDEFYKYLQNLKEGSVILLHASCHNPSGEDFTQEQWLKIVKVCQNNKILPFFDCAYQGLGLGLNEDIFSIRLFAEHLEEFILAYSCSKNFGLYGERTGALFFFSNHQETKHTISSILKQSIRATYSNPPRRGALIVATILSDPLLKQLWKEELKAYMERIHHYRKKYKEALEALLDRDFSYVTLGNGLFVFTGLTEKQVVELRENDAIYLSSDGRLNLTGLNEKNFNHVIGVLAKYL